MHHDDYNAHHALKETRPTLDVDLTPKMPWSQVLTRAAMVVGFILLVVAIGKWLADVLVWGDW